MQYIPSIHRGTDEEIINGLIQEAENISRGGMLRLHAKDREMRRVASQLKDLGIEIMEGTEEDAGYFIVVKLPHGDICTENNCRCEPIRRFIAY
jgi:hypothetical protein